MNLGAMADQYGPRVRAAARALGDAGLIDLLGSDLHQPAQVERYTAKAWANLARTRWRFSPEYHHRLFAAGGIGAAIRWVGSNGGKSCQSGNGCSNICTHPLHPLF